MYKSFLTYFFLAFCTTNRFRAWPIKCNLNFGFWNKSKQERSSTSGATLDAMAPNMCKQHPTSEYNRELDFLWRTLWYLHRNGLTIFWLVVRCRRVPQISHSWNIRKCPFWTSSAMVQLQVLSPDFLGCELRLSRQWRQNISWHQRNHSELTCKIL